MEITSSLVRDLRERTGAGLMDCKRALEATGGHMEQAEDHLRKQGLKKAEKKADRAMGEGRVVSSIAPNGRSGSLLAVTCETDFVAKTPDFERLLAELLAHIQASAPEDVEDLLAQTLKARGTPVREAVQAAVGKLGENIQIARVQHFENSRGRIGTYVHHNQKVGVLASVTTDAPGEVAAEALKALCMHVAAIKPTAARREDITAETIERERAIYFEEVKGKPADLQEKILGKKLEKFFADNVLPEQRWFKDDTKSVLQAMTELLGKGTRIEAFARFQIG